MERNDKILTRKIEEEIKKYSQLQTLFTKIAETETTSMNNRINHFSTLNKINETDNEYLKKIYSIFQSTMIEVEKLRETKIKKINELIVPATVYYPRRAREFKTEMSKINEIKSSKGKQLKELEKAQSVKDADKMSKVNAVIEKYKQEENLKGNEFEERLTNFEQERVMDNKYLLLHYIHSELAHHATALEKLSKLYSEMMCYDPRENLGDFVNVMALNSMKEINLANKYGYVPGETTRRLEKIKNPNAGNSKVVPAYNSNPSSVSLSGLRGTAAVFKGDDPFANDLTVNKQATNQNAMKSSNFNTANTANQMPILNQK